MRIITGYLRGRRIKVPSVARPLPAVIREALFQVVDVEDKVFIDLFAGSGAIAIEAISNGAREALAVDISPLACRYIKENAVSLGIADRLTVLRGDAKVILKRLLMKSWGHPLVIFAGPPFKIAKPSVRELIKILRENPSQELEFFIVQYPSKEELPNELETIPWSRWQRRYGDNLLIILRKGEDRDE